MNYQRFALADYINQQQSQGKIVFTYADAHDALQLGKRTFLDAAGRQIKRGHLVNPRRGFYVVVPPPFLNWGAPPPSWYIDALMRYEGRPYYVGLLKAAELHGATHQAVQQFQVVTNKRMPKIVVGRSALVFYYRKDMDRLADATVAWKTETGTMQASTPELTAFDILRYAHACGGVDHIATVLVDLAPQLNATALSKISRTFECSIVQRLGYLLEQLGFGAKSNRLHQQTKPGNAAWVELDPHLASDPDLRPAIIERNQRWRVVVRHVPEPDA